MEQLARPAYPIAADAVEYWTHKLSLGLPEDTDLLSTDWFQRHARSGAGRALQDWCSGSPLDASDQCMRSCRDTQVQTIPVWMAVVQCWIVA